MKRRTLAALVAVFSLLLLCGIVGSLKLNEAMSRQAEDEVIQTLRQALHQSVLNLNDRMQAVEDASLLLMLDERTQTMLARTPAQDDMETAMGDLENLRTLFEPVLLREDIAQVRMYLPDERILSREKINFFPLSKFEGTDACTRLLAGDARTLWLAQGETLAFARAMRSPHDYDAVSGYLIAYMPAKVLREVLAEFQLSEGVQLLLLDEQGNCALSRDGLAPDDAMLERAFGQTQAVERFAEEGVVSIQEALLPVGWRVLMAVPEKALIANHTLLRNANALLFVAVLLIACIGVSCLVFVFYTHGVNEHIRALNRTLAREGIRGFQADSGRRDIYFLEQGLCELVETMRRTTEESYRVRLREREAVFRALQAQINPHFLYNTLDTIHWMALRHGAQDIADVLDSLARYFRLSLSGGKDIVPLRTEIEIVRAYLEIQLVRFDGGFRVDWRVEEAALACTLPKLTLQPIVENAVLHGIRRREEETGGQITIEAALRGEELCLCVMDNGPGLTQSGTDKQTDEGGYGLRNIRDRLDFFTNGHFEFTVQEGRGGGVRVCMSLPVRG